MESKAESSLVLLDRARGGDHDAVDELVRRYLPRLRRWAHGRLPDRARDLLDTEDIVQETMVKAVRNLDRFEIRGEGALQAYLRQALANRLTDAYRGAARKPEPVEMPSDMQARGPSPLEQVIGRDAIGRYEAGLQRLKQDEREAIVLRLELGYEYSEIAQMLGKPSAAAARMAIGRALARLSREMLAAGQD